MANPEDKKAEEQGSNIQNQDEKEKLEHAEHIEQVKQEHGESKREKKKISGIQNKLKGGFGPRKNAMFGSKFTHGSIGKPTLGPRGN